MARSGASRVSGLVRHESDQLDDIGSSTLASEIARKIESEMEYPGQIKVTVIREVRAIDYAK